jgi:hypothetical protein
MKSFIYIIITIAACSIVYGYAEKNPVIYAPQISAINVDGVLSDWESSSGWVTFGKWYPVANPGLSSTTKARYAWNEATNLLYIGIESTEGIGAVLEIGGLYATMDYNRDTSISALTEQLGLNPATQIEFSQWSGGTPQSIFNQDYGTTAGIVARYTYDGTKLTIEMAIPIYSNWFDSGSAMSLTSSMDVYVYANIFNAGWTAGDSQVADGRYMYLAKGSVVNRGSLVRLRPQAKPLNCDDVPYFGKDIADLDGNCMVNLADFAMIAASWMRCTDPCGIECDTFSGVIVKVDDYGAHGNGVDDDTAAFQSAAEVVQAFGGAISLGHNKVYRVGEQIHTDGVYPYYVYQPIISIDGVHGNKVAIIGNGATLKLNDGLRFGSFDKNTGAVYNPTLPFTDHAYDVGVGNIIQITNCDEVEIRDLTIDGNIDSVVLGGFFGDTGRQCDGVGVYLSKNSKVSVYNAYSHHNTLDGFYIADATATAGVLKPHSLMNVESFYNARQGLSWVGGNGLTVFDSKFSYTGRATFTSSPGAGCDIEAMVINRNGQFTNCKFVDNVGEGLIS